MPIVAKLDEYGKGAWLAFAVLGFIIWWPLGLATLFAGAVFLLPR